MKTWIEPSPVIVPDALRDFTGGHDLIAQTLAQPLPPRVIGDALVEAVVTRGAPDNVTVVVVRIERAEA